MNFYPFQSHYSRVIWTREVLRTMIWKQLVYWTFYTNVKTVDSWLGRITRQWVPVLPFVDWNSKKKKLSVEFFLRHIWKSMISKRPPHYSNVIRLLYFKLLLYTFVQFHLKSTFYENEIPFYGFVKFQIQGLVSRYNGYYINFKRMQVIC